MLCMGVHRLFTMAAYTLAIILPMMPTLAVAATDGAAIAQNGTSGGALACSGCHGQAGEGNYEAGFPRLAGQNAAYLIHQLQSFADGSRFNEVMSPIAKILNPDEIKAVAGYYSTATPPKNVVPPQPDAAPVSNAALIAAGEELVRNGAWAKGVPACAQCHGADGRGVGAMFPALAGQSGQYVATQLAAWRSGARHNDPLGLMKRIADKLDDAEMAAVAAYYASLPLSGATPSDAMAAPAASPASGAASATATSSGAATAAYQPPSDADIPNDEFGAMIRRGKAIFMDPKTHAARYVGNDLACVNCHLDRGRLAHSAPLGAAYLLYPAYRKKNNQVNSYAERLQGCFSYSMNGKAPPADDDVILALTSYSFFLARGAPVGVKISGQGYAKMKPPARDALDFKQGERVYGEKCALCHGADGQGQKNAAGKVVFPPLWGARSYNWGAGMALITNAAAFIHANMPFGAGNTLTEQEAWNVAAFVNSHERPQDPRFNGSLSQTRAKYHDDPMDLYGTTVNGITLGQKSPPSGSKVRD